MVKGQAPSALLRLAATIQDQAPELALEVVEEGLREDAVPSLARLSPEGQVGGIPTFIREVAGQLATAQPVPLKVGSPLAVLARRHAADREELGFAPREVLAEFLLLRRILWRFVRSDSTLEAQELQDLQAQLHDTIDRLVAECVVSYFDRAIADLAIQARRDALTALLNHQAFTRDLELELVRAQRYGHGLALVFFDIDRFKLVNDTYGHPHGDRVLRAVAELVRETVRRSDLAGRMGGDEFAVALVESELEAATRFLARLTARIGELTDAGDLPPGFAISPGIAHFPSEAQDADALFRLADERLYEVKRSRNID